MKKSYSTVGLIGALAAGTLAGAALGVYLTLTRNGNASREMGTETKNLARNLKKKAQKKAKSVRKEDWLAQEKDKIMNHGR